MQHIQIIEIMVVQKIQRQKFNSSDSSVANITIKIKMDIMSLKIRSVFDRIVISFALF